MRRNFHPILLAHMREDPKIRLILPDLGYRMFDQIWAEFPDRSLNVGASEQLAIGAAVGMTYKGLIPVVYSITPFLLWRAAEWIRNYLENEKVPVRLLGAGRNRDYGEDGFTHDASDDKTLLASCFPSVKGFWPQSVEELPAVTREWLYGPGGASYLNLKR